MRTKIVYPALFFSVCGFLKGKGLSRFKEIKLATGLGHGILYRPIPEWVDPATAWANEMAALHNETLE